MQFHIEPEISWSSWLKQACILDGQFTELGEFLQSKLIGGIFIDVPCGLENKTAKGDCNVIDVVKMLGVSTYIEVDKDAEILGERLRNPERTVGDMKIQAYQSDILDFIAQLQVNRETPKRAIYISGLQPNEDFCSNSDNLSTIVIPYLQALYDELGRISHVGDLVILNEANALVSGINEEKYSDIHPSIALIQHGFICKRTCPHNKVQIFEKTS